MTKIDFIMVVDKLTHEQFKIKKGNKSLFEDTLEVLRRKYG